MTDFNLPEIDVVEAANAGIEFSLERLDGEPLLNAKKEAVTLTVLGTDSETYRKASRKLAKARVDRASKKGQRLGADEALDLLDAENVDLLVACTTNWSGVLDSKDKPVPFTEASCRAFYLKFPPAREQADRVISDRTRFIKPLSEG